MTRSRDNATNVAGDISGITAGVGLSGGGLSGNVTVTNSMATAIDQKADLVVGTAADTFSRLAVGTNNHTLIADSSAETGLSYAAGSKATLTTTGDILYASAANTPARLGIGSSGQILTVASGIPSWATASSGGGMTSIASGNLNTGSNTLVLDPISGDYNDLHLIVRDIYPSNSGYVFQVTVNSVADYDYIYDIGGGGFIGANATFNPYYDPPTNTNDENFIHLIFKDYTNTSSDKAISSFYHYNSIKPRTGEIAIVFGVASTTSAITKISLTIQSGGGNWGAAGSYVLYGVK